VNKKDATRWVASLILGWDEGLVWDWFGGPLFYFGEFSGGAAAFHYSFAHAQGELFREFVGLVTAVDVDGLAGRVDDDFAVMAGAEVLFDLSQKIGVDLTIEVVG